MPKEKNNLEKAGQAQDAAQHYDKMIWTVFSVGIALSLFVLYFVWIHWRDDILGSRFLVRSFMIILGYSVFLYCSFILEDFRRKKKILRTYQNKLYKHPLDSFKSDNFGVFFFLISLFLINFGYIHTFLRLAFEYFQISLNQFQLFLYSYFPSFICSMLVKVIIFRKIIFQK